MNTTTVAYSGEIDKQKAAADIMALAFKREGMKLTHIIGPKTGHKYEPQAKEKVSRLVDAAVSDDRDAALDRRGDRADRAELRDADAGDDARGADRAGADADLDSVYPRLL